MTKRIALIDGRRPTSAALAAAFAEALERSTMNLMAVYHRPKRPPRLDTELAREIAAHNDAIDAKNAARKARRANR